MLVTGGTDKIGNILQDAWILDVMSGRWRKVSGREVSGDVHNKCTATTDLGNFYPLK